MALSYSRKLKIKVWALKSIVFLSVLFWIPMMIFMPSPRLWLAWGLIFFAINYLVFYFQQKKIILKADDFFDRIEISLSQVKSHKADYIYLKHNYNILEYRVSLSFKIYFTKQFEKEWKEIFYSDQLELKFKSDKSQLKLKPIGDYFYNLCKNFEGLINGECYNCTPIYDDYFLIPFEYHYEKLKNETNSRLYAIVEMNNNNYTVLNVYCTELTENILLERLISEFKSISS